MKPEHGVCLISVKFVYSCCLCMYSSVQVSLFFQVGRKGEEFPLSAPGLNTDQFPVGSSNGFSVGRSLIFLIALVPVSKHLVKVAFIIVVLWISMSESIRSVRHRFLVHRQVESF